MRTKYIFITGGVLSSLGKGLSAASLGALLESRGLSVAMQKLDPYINVDPGTMNPLQHGEVYVTDDGAETDLDLGHYERYTHAPITHLSNFTSGQIYFSVIQKERDGKYLGSTVQVIPHITDEIKSCIKECAGKQDVSIVEIGGTVGDIESLPFLEAIRQFKTDVGEENVLYIHLTLVPYIETAGELKTKPTQHSVKELREIGILPDILLCRTTRKLPAEVKKKIALFCNVSPDAVITAQDVDNIYEVPLFFHEEGLDEKVVEILKMWTKSPDLKNWQTLVQNIKSQNKEINIGVVGKYVQVVDSYKSLHEALVHAGIANGVKVKPCYIDSEEVEKKPDADFLDGLDGILVPGGFGSRGIEGMAIAIKHARENNVPFFGICLGMQVAVIEYARNVANMTNANSLEFDNDTKYPVISLMEEQKKVTKKGATMRLGAYACELVKDSFAFRAYQQSSISERHRHRFELNNDLRGQLQESGLTMSGFNKESDLVEIIEVDSHPWFLGCQFHPEFKSKPMQAHPLFRDFIAAAVKYSDR